MSQLKLFFLPHTHWDREWYLSFEEFRSQLLQLIDQLIEIMKKNPSYIFLLDGQTIILEDYFQIRGKNLGLLKLIEQGRIKIGPWYVLPDEFLVSGEALIRNLKLGRKISRELGTEPVSVGYLPDMFGHISQMPEILSGFGIESALVWRGVPKMERNQFFWKSPSGKKILAIYLPLGYGFIFNLSRVLEEFLNQVGLFLGLIQAQDPSGVYLFLVGTDHWFPDPELARTIKKAQEHKQEWELKMAPLEEYISVLKPELKDIPEYQGELRSPARTQILPGTASARLYLKEMNFRAQALLEKYLEPALALSFFNRKNSHQKELEYLWKLLLSNHPHDSICGCSIDPVHREMETRYEKIFQLGKTLLKSSLCHLTFLGDAQPERVLFWNPSGRTQSGVITFRTRLPIKTPLTALDEQGRKIFFEEIKPKEKDQLLYQILVPSAFSWLAFNYFMAEQIFGLYLQKIFWKKTKSALEIKIGLGDEPIDFPLEKYLKKIKSKIEKEKIPLIHFQLYRLGEKRLLGIAGELKPGLNCFKIVKEKKIPEKTPEFRSSEKGIENHLLKIQPTPSGKLKILDKETQREIIMEFSDRADRGDSYNFDPLPDDIPITEPKKFRVKKIQSGKSYAQMVLEHIYQIPFELSPDRKKRAGKKVLLRLQTRLWLYSGIKRVDFQTRFFNSARDHRLQVDFWFPDLVEHFWAESGFDLVKRAVIEESPPPSPSLTEISQLVLGSEAESSSSPIQNFAFLEKDGQGMILAGKGLSEVICSHHLQEKKTSLSFTLCRSIGWLSRTDLTYRTGMAGPPIPVPEAQCLREFNWEYSLMLFSHPPDKGEIFSQAYQFVFPPLVFLAGSVPEIPFQLKSPKIILSALYPSKDRLIARFFNPAENKEILELELSAKISNIEPVNLEEKPIPYPELHFQGQFLKAELNPGEIFTLALQRNH